MDIIFEAESGMGQGIAKIVTHPAEQGQWGNIEAAIQAAERRIVVINAKNDRNVSIVTNTIAVIEPEGRMCSVRVITGEMFLLNTRLKFALEVLDSPRFMKINYQTIINTSYIKEFSATDNARIKVNLTDGSYYYVSRYYMNNFRRSYHG
ncbi:LytTR family DNA-binding domain-containing protein [Paenibacillus phytohabitans]|uniref:LytTR family DNA-binding domain-containing protein n=1 Tax=Paenibacillus phytohabitans TaxID=2654978 RepID=UPI00300AE929